MPQAMAPIVIRRPHQLPLAEARARAERVARRAEAQRDARWYWQGDVMELSAATGIASGARGRVVLDDTHVAIEIHLPLALRPARRFVEAQVISRLDKLLAP